MNGTIYYPEKFLYVFVNKSLAGSSSIAPDYTPTECLACVSTDALYK